VVRIVEKHKKFVKLPKGYQIIHDEKAIVLDIPQCAIKIYLPENKFSTDSKKLSTGCYYRIPIEEDRGFMVRKLNENYMELYEYLELKPGKIIINKLLESKAEK
jgi:hypothetical protein